jgi:dihydrofolate reductase
MRKLVLQIQMSLDGYVGDRNGDVQWAFPAFDDEFTQWGIDSLTRAGVHIMGGRTGKALSEYWPAATEPRDLPFAPVFNANPKVIFSKTLETVDWNNTTIARGDVEEEIARLKAQDGGDYILLHGGATFARALSQLGLIDEYHLMVHPVVLGAGDALFPPFDPPLRLELIDSRRFKSGCVLQTYRRAADEGTPR